MLTKKRKLLEDEIVTLIEEYSAIIKMLPSKLKAPESFTVSCSIENPHNLNVSIDFWASINLMSLSIYRKLGLDDPKANQ